MAGYTRFDVTNQIADTNVINAAPLNGEFDAVEAAFNAISGHRHDGTSAEGAPITVVGPAQDIVVTATVLRPKTDNAVDLGTSSLEFKDLWIDGTANIDSLVVDTADINGGTIDATVIGGTTPAAATITSLTATSGTVGGSAITTAANTQTLTNKTLTSPIITGGTIDGATPATISGTQTLTNKTINLTNNTLVATSAQLAAAITDETGTGAVVFAESPALTGTPTAPTAAAATNTTQIATTAHVFAERSNTATLTNKTLTTPTINGGTITGITDLAIADGGTGSSTAAGALVNLGLTATAAELNVMDGVTATTDEINKATTFGLIAQGTLSGSQLIIEIPADFESVEITVWNYQPTTNGTALQLVVGSGTIGVPVWGTAHYQQGMVIAGVSPGYYNASAAAQFDVSHLQSNTSTGYSSHTLNGFHVSGPVRGHGFRYGIDSGAVTRTTYESCGETGAVVHSLIRLFVATGSMSGTYRITGYRKP